MNRKPFLAIGTVLGIGAAAGVAFALAGYPGQVRAAGAEASFKEDVLPIFKGRCVECHAPGGDGYQKSGLDLRSYEGLMKGTKFGAMIVPGEPETSSLMRLLDWKASPELRMPHGTKKLSTCDRDAIRNWIRQGAKNN
jgi:mono/diheme cytochrome c family protein